MGQNRFSVIREDLLQDPVTIISEGLLIGRLVECELLLNHPAVSRAQAGIKEIDDNYYLFSLRPSNPPQLNGKAVEQNEALAPGDVIAIGPFLLEIDRTDEGLTIKVSLQIGVEVAGDQDNPLIGTTQKLVMPEPGKKPAKARAAPLPGNKTLDIFWDKRIREAGKMVRPSPLFPKAQRRSGKAQFNWRPTSDLARGWPVALLIWGAVIVSVFSIVGIFWYANAYAPAPLSSSHSRNQLAMVPPIAKQANSDSCTNCHAFSGNMDSRCGSCHSTAVFEATVIKPHVTAGIGCSDCHAEHRGADFKPGLTALATCTECHNDANQRVFHGRKVGTPHGGTFGYPVVDGHWKWSGLADDEWALKKIDVARLPTDNDEQWRSKQFHALHVQRVKKVGEMPGNARGELSCSSCHRSFDQIDRETPRTTCATCHNGKVELGTNRQLIANNQPNCTSCHVQHVKDKRHVSNADWRLPIAN
ncbi:MAG TPA: FHA domain-containing protein [Pyrinomonadaceae bacterium]|nr:FHA domain-containing protein [Pyrinomonadaceae bacterium]